MNINKCICTGRLRKDPELRQVSEDLSVSRTGFHGDRVWWVPCCSHESVVASLDSSTR
jgi:single-stranded DNA-binding protein